MTTEETVPAADVLREIAGELTIGSYLRAIREGEEWTLAEMSAKLGVSVQHLSNIENGSKSVSPKRAAEWAKVLGYPEGGFVELAVSDSLKRDGLPYAVTLKRRGAA